MTSSSSTLTPRDLLQLARPSGTPQSNPASTCAAWSSSQFSFDAVQGKGRTTKSIYVVDLTAKSRANTAPRQVLTNLASTDCAWLNADTLLFTRPPYAESKSTQPRQDHPEDLSDDEQSKRLKANVAAADHRVELWAKDVREGSNEEYLVAKLPVAISDLKVTHVASSEKEQGAILTFSAEVFPDGDIYKVAEHEAEVEKAAEGSDVRVYNSLPVRHWDTWTPTDGQRKQLFFIRLTRNPDSLISEDSDGFEHVERPHAQEDEGAVPAGRWTALMDKEQAVDEASKDSNKTERVMVKSPLAGTKLECPVGPFGGASDFSVSSTHLVFHAKDPHVNPMWHTRTQVYLLPLSPRFASDAVPRALTVGTQGACANPVFSKDGKRIAWLEMREDGYEADRHRVMIYEVESGKRWGVSEKWDRSPSAVEWCPCGEKVYLVAEDGGHSKLFQLAVPVPSSDDFESSYSSPEPQALTHDGTVAGMTPLSTSSLLLSINSLTGPNQLYTLSLPSLSDSKDSKSGPKLEMLASLTPSLAKDKKLVPAESFYFAGAEGRQVHGFISFPPGFKAAQTEGTGKKWPMAFLVHGGPQGAWTDGWSTRWNPQTYAHAGFITVAINPTGSTGYGQEFCDRIKNQWGGYPYQDLVAGLEFVKENYPEIDPERMCMLGASYGGYMANWMQGHNDSLGFKTIVCHDGVFNTTNTYYTTEELYFPEREFGGSPWDVPESYSRWNPVNHIHNWRTPMLIIHGGKDYRLLEAESLAMFNTLQRRGVASRLVYFESENHWVLRPANSAKWHKEVLDWITEWTAEAADGKAQGEAATKQAKRAALDESARQTMVNQGLAGNSKAQAQQPGYRVAYK